MSKVGHNRIQLGDDSDPNKNFVIGTPSPNDGTLEVRKGTVEVPGDLVARFTGANLELGATGQAVKSAAFLDVVGTVSQVGGVPTGALLEHGSNANGMYWKFASGLQICQVRMSVTNQAISDTYASGLYQGTRGWTFPAAFITPPAVSCSEFRWGTSASWGTIGGAPSSVGVTLRAIDASPRSAGTETIISAIAVGRWF